MILKKKLFSAKNYSTKGKMAGENKKVKLDDAEKFELIFFYKENKVSLSNAVDKKGKSEAKQKLVDLFNQRHDAEIFGKTIPCSSYCFS